MLFAKIKYPLTIVTLRYVQSLIYFRSLALEAESSNHAKEKQVLELSLKVKEEEITVKEECVTSLEKELHQLHAKCKELEVEGNKLDSCVKEFKYVFCFVMAYIY